MNNDKLYIFDAPTRIAFPYEERIKFLQQNIRVSSLFSIITPVKVNSVQGVSEKMKKCDGLVFRKPNSRYLETDSCFKWMVIKNNFISRNRKKRMSWLHQ